jgi:hypothetical protein
MVDPSFASSLKIGNERRNRNESQQFKSVGLVWRGSQVVRPRSAKPLLTGSIPVPASLKNFFSEGAINRKGP